MARPLIAWSVVSLCACDPSLSGYDLKRPRDGGADASTLDHAAPPLGSGGHGGAGWRDPTFTVASTKELGLLEPAHGVFFRDGAASGSFGTTPRWLFHDTYWARQSHFRMTRTVRVSGE